MSVDFAGKSGHTHNTVAVSNLATVTAATFNGGDVTMAGNFRLTVDTAAGAVDAATLPTSLTLADGSEAFTDGVRVTLIKATADNNTITFLDPLLSITFNYVNRQGESITLVLDGNAGTPRWIAEL